MKQFLMCCVVLFGAALGAHAQDDKKTDKKADPIKQPEPQKKADAEPPAKENPQDAEKEVNRLKELVTRLNKNMQASEDRLGKKDPGDGTRQIQRDIVKDLDELIEQSKKQQNQGGGSSQQSQSQPQGGAQSQPKPQNQNQDQQNQEAECKKCECKNGGGEKPGESKGGGEGSGASSGKAPGQGPGQEAGQVKSGKENIERPKSASLEEKGNDKKPMGQSKGEGQKDPKDGDGGSVARAKDHNPAVRNPLGDLYRNLWGELPQRRLQEMDAYQRERFMQRYEELLRQYYRTLSEQNRKQ